MSSVDDPYDLDAGTSEHYVDAELYDFEYRRRRADVNHYRRLAKRWRPRGSILELGCGTGRLLAPLARDGHPIVGIDVAAPMLRRARARVNGLGKAARARVSLVRADMRQFAFATEFPLVICPFNAFQHLYTHTEVSACLAAVRRHLAPDGRFAFDVMNPDLRWLTRDPRKRWARTKFHHPVTGAYYEYSTNQTYDPVAQIAHMRIYYVPLDEPEESRRTHVVRLTQRQFFPAELEGLLAAHGFLVEDRWGGFDSQSFAGVSDSQVLVCRLKKK